MKKSLITLVQMWQAESPDLFKWVTKISIGMVTLGGVLLGAPTTIAAAGVTNYTQPQWMSFIATHLIVVGVYGGILSKLTTKNPIQNN